MPSLALFSAVVESAGEIPETLINGGANISQPGIYNIGGTDFVYSRNNKTEKILALGPIKEHLIVKVFNITTGIVCIW